jgi:hypothetical protein
VPVFVLPRALPIIHKSTSEIALFKEEGKENAPAEQGTDDGTAGSMVMKTPFA